MSLVAIVGLKREAQLLKGRADRIVIGGGDAERLREHLDRALIAGTRGIISIGLAGALSSELRVGDCVIATAVALGSTRLSTDTAWASQLLRRLPYAKAGAILHVEQPVTGVGHKGALGRESNAQAVDMESGHAAHAALARNIPFAALRVISDSIEEDLPPAVRVAMNPDGGVNYAAVAGSILAKPSQIPALIRTGRNADRAFKALFRSLEILGAGLACPYLG